MALVLSLPIWQPEFYGFPYVVDPQFRTLSDKTEDGRTDTRIIWVRPKRLITISGEFVLDTEIQTIENHWMTRMGAGRHFYWEDIQIIDGASQKASEVKNEILGIGDGIEDTFYYQRTFVHESEAQAFTVSYVKNGTTTVRKDNAGDGNFVVVDPGLYDNHIEKSSAADKARIIFDTPPAIDDVVKVDFTELIKVHFVTDSFRKSLDGVTSYSYSFQMEEILD